MSDEARERLFALLGSPFELSRRDGRWLALAPDRIAFAVDDDAGWRRLGQEAWLLEKWRAGGVPAPRVLLDDPIRRVQIRERMHGLSGTEIHRETELSPLYAGPKNPDVRERLRDAPLSAFGERLAASYGDLAARIRRSVDVADARAVGVPATSRRALDVDAAITALDATPASDVAKRSARRVRDWLVELPPIDAVIHADLHFHNMCASPTGEIVGVFDLSDAGPDSAETELGYAHSLGSRFARLALDAHDGKLDERLVIHSHLRIALDHLLWHGPGTERHASIVAWASAVFELLA